MSREAIGMILFIIFMLPTVGAWIVASIIDTRREKEEIEKMWKETRSRRYTFRMVTCRGEKEIEI